MPRNRAWLRSIAKEVVAMMLVESKPFADAGAAKIPPELLAHCFGTVCSKHQLSEAEIWRVWSMTPSEVDRMQKSVRTLAAVILGTASKSASSKPTGPLQ